MLSFLELKNYIFIKHLCLEFDNGLNIFTGQTGAGKSIIVEAISFLLGEKISNKIVGNFDEKCEIVGIFDFLNNKIFYEHFDFIDKKSTQQIIIRREIDKNNRSRCFINDVIVSVSTLKNFSDLILDIHGQNEHQKLLSPLFQLIALDEYCNLLQNISDYSKKYVLYRKKLEERNNIENEISLNQQKIEILKYQLNEIEQAKLTSDDEKIDLEFEKAKNAQKILNLCGDIKYNIQEIKQKVFILKKQLENLKILTNNSTVFNFENIENEIENLNELIERYQKTFSNYTTDYIDSLLDRVDLIKKLKRKYGNSIEEIKIYYEKTREELKNINIKEKNLEELNNEISQLEKELIYLAEKISLVRKQKSKIFIEEVNKELHTLGLQKAKLDISIETLDYKIENISNYGFDKVEFLVSTNPGSKFQPLKNIVSGGELSRIMLAIKTVLGMKENTPILVFDEIDLGVGGPVGFIIGEKLKQLSLKGKQIFCITHLPQIACFADKHFLVKKEQTKDSTKITVEILEEENRVKEIARMLSGAKIDDTSLKHAKNLIKDAINCLK